MIARGLAGCVALALLAAACEAPATATAQPLAETRSFPMGGCVNLGNALEAETEGSWGYSIARADLARIRAAGFDGVRVPVRWDPHTGPAPVYPVNDRFMARVQEVVDQALAEGLRVQLNVHHFEGLVANPDSRAETARFVAIWGQIAARFAAYDDRLMFELLNEPFGDQWNSARLEELHGLALAAIRPTNPRRLVIVGGIHWNNIVGLEAYTPPQDRHIALTLHSYFPYEFTHQGADWLGAEAPRWDRPWGTQGDIAELRSEMRRAAAVGRRWGLPVQLGEFGVINEAPLDQRLAWLRAMREAAEANGVAWCVWDFGVAFNVYDRATGRWVPGAREALGLGG
jgi:endoglucanase